jgi:hypothetical protein
MIIVGGVTVPVKLLGAMDISASVALQASFNFVAFAELSGSARLGARYENGAMTRGC